MENTQSKPPQQFQRKTILIKKHLQYRYMALIFFSVLVAFIVVGLDIVWTVSKVVEEHPMMQPLLEEFSAEAGIAQLPEEQRFEHFSSFLAVSRHLSESFDTADTVTGSGGTPASTRSPSS